MSLRRSAAWRLHVVYPHGVGGRLATPGLRGDREAVFASLGAAPIGRRPRTHLLFSAADTSTMASRNSRSIYDAGRLWWGTESGSSPIARTSASAWSYSAASTARLPATSLANRRPCPLSC